jgi:hypothetical protein
MILPLSDTAMFFGLLAVAGIVLIGIGLLYLKRIRKTGSLPAADPGQKASRFAYQPDKRQMPVVTLKAIPHPVARKPSVPIPERKEVSLLNGMSDISASLVALVDKYSLEQFTIATSDGLVFASSGAASAMDDAAKYSEVYITDSLSETPGVVLSGVSHKGSDLILIIRTHQPVPEKIRKGIENDTKDILNWWI